jgi:hypothetical protein
MIKVRCLEIWELKVLCGACSLCTGCQLVWVWKNNMLKQKVIWSRIITYRWAESIKEAPEAIMS